MTVLSSCARWCGVIALVGAGCGSSTSSPTVSAIGITPNPCAVSRTNSVQMSAQATMPDGTKKDISTASGVEWSSGNTGTLTVNESGMVVGVNPGITSVNVAYSGATGSVNCTVGP